MNIEERFEKLRNCHAIQDTKGNYDEYMRGMFNGLELALAILDDRDVEYKDFIGEPDRNETENANINIHGAFNRLKKALKENDSYAHEWHCKIACMCRDAIESKQPQIDCSSDAHEIGNDAATRFMKRCFNIETSNDMLMKQTNEDKPGN